MKTWAILLCCLLSGCAGMQRDEARDVAPLFHDAGFKAPSAPVGAAGLFDLSPEMSAYLHSPAFRTQLRQKGLDHGLVDALYAKGELKIDYDSAMTRTAAQTYAAHAGNCLSLVIMTAAFAKELGMPVRYQRVDVDRSWSRDAGLYLASSHVNLSLGGHRPDMLRQVDNESLLTIDFLPSEEAGRFHTRQLDEEDIVAMYMNNRAAESLVQDRLDDAYWWARAAVAQRPSLLMAYNTLAVVYQRHGDSVQAERVLRAALEREPENVVVMENLVTTLGALGKDAEARALAQRIARLEPNPPFRFFDQGMQALRGGDYRTAKELFAREVKRAPYYDEFHFWLAIACLRLGEATQAREQLALAADTSTRRDTRDRYSAKLAHLRALGAPLPN